MMLKDKVCGIVTAQHKWSFDLLKINLISFKKIFVLNNNDNRSVLNILDSLVIPFDLL